MTQAVASPVESTSQAVRVVIGSVSANPMGSIDSVPFHKGRPANGPGVR